MKKVLAVVITIFVLSLTFVSAAESYGIKVQLNGQYIDFTDEQGNKVEPQLINNRTMVPLRKIFEAFDCKIDWEQETKTVTAQNGSKEIVLSIDNDTAIVTESGEKKEIKLDSAPVIVENRTLVPVRFIAESLEKDVSWVQDRKIVVILDNDKLAKEFEERVPDLQKIFDLHLNEITSFKSSSTISGTMKYTDSEDKANNETINIKGTANVLLSKQDFQLDIILNISGKDSTIFDSIKEAGLEKINYRIVFKDGKMYMGAFDGKEYQWEQTDYLDEALETELSYPELTNNLNSMTADSYESLLAVIMELVGEKNENTYNALIEAFDMMGKLLNNHLTYTESKGKGTLSFDMDLSELLTELMPEAQEDINSSLVLKVSSKLTIENKTISGENESIDFKFSAPDSKETLDISAKITTKFTDINKEIKIEAPKV